MLIERQPTARPSRLPRFRSVFLKSRPKREISPTDPGTRYWANVSVTNNSTQQITMINPE
jgi:hypothetical protein